MSDRLPALQIKNENSGIIDQKNLLNMIESYSKETLKSTERMLEYCNLSETAGVKTLMALDEQGEKLNRANDGLNLVENDLESVEYNLNKLEMGIFNCCCCCCVSRKDGGKRNFLFSCWMILKKKCLTCRKINSCSSINQSKSQTISLNSKSGSELSIKSFKSKLNVRKENIRSRKRACRLEPGIERKKFYRHFARRNSVAVDDVGDINARLQKWQQLGEPSSFYFLIAWRSGK